MKYWKLIPAVLMVLLVAGSSQAEEKSAKEAHAEKVKTMEDYLRVKRLLFYIYFHLKLIIALRRVTY